MATDSYWWLLMAAGATHCIVPQENTCFVLCTAQYMVWAGKLVTNPHFGQHNLSIAQIHALHRTHIHKHKWKRDNKRQTGVIFNIHTICTCTSTFSTGVNCACMYLYTSQNIRVHEHTNLFLPFESTELLWKKHRKNSSIMNSTFDTY